MFDANDTEKHSVKTIYADGTAHVEDFRIRPIEVEECSLKMKVLMRIGGAEAVYYLLAVVTYDGEDPGHHVTIRRRGSGVVDEFETDMVTASPRHEMEAVQALHETYVQAAGDWYSYARAADMAGNDDE